MRVPTDEEAPPVAADENVRTHLTALSTEAEHPAGAFTTEQTPLYCATRVVVAALTGLVFGFCMHKSWVFQPEILRGQFSFDDWSMVKVFVAAVASSLLVNTLVVGKVSPGARARVAKSYREKQVGLPAVMAGTFALGAGMALSGSCPGSGAVQIGAWLYPAWVTVAGMLAGALAFALSAEQLAGFRKRGMTTEGMRGVDSVLGLSLDVTSLVAAAAMAGMLALVEHLSPTAYPEENGSGLTALRWSPILAGAVIGSLQIPLTLVLYKNTGSSSSYVTIVSWALFFVKSNKALTAARSGIGNVWQVVYMGSAVLASYLCVVITDGESFGVDSGVELWQAFVGGFLMLYGSRLAGGCTSGHGLAGAGHLNLPSWVAIGCMFAGGIPVAFLLK